MGQDCNWMHVSILTVTHENGTCAHWLLLVIPSDLSVRGFLKCRFVMPFLYNRVLASRFREL